MYQPSTDIVDPATTVDLRSDTVTRPSQAMRDRIASAVVGDDVNEEDPTTIELERRVAQILGQEAGLLVTAGSQGNLLAGLVHCKDRGSEIICGDKTHIFLYEQGSSAQFGGIQSNPVPMETDGTFSLEGIRSRIRDHTNFHYPKTNMIAVENTQNYYGGAVLPLEWIDEVLKIGRENGIATHLDGARLFNASVASGVPAERIAGGFDSVTICLSKGLGAPIGSVLCGSAAFIKQARRLRKALGGGMRQTGILAAAGLYSIENMIDRLAEDHKHAKLVANAVVALQSPAVTVNLSTVQSNMVLLMVNQNISAKEFCDRLGVITPQEEADLKETAIKIRTWPRTENRIRLVFHCDVSAEQTARTATKIAYVAKEFEAKLQA